ncbi:hypothetical protein SY88_01080 [Clostridiales bacterium PH28_bin88]|nr:hypothetical protein SY88_01080 [Clostridiales bacterium PH28_bin88]
MNRPSSLLDFNLAYLLSNDGRVIQVAASLQQGGILAVRGSSGSGKSTLLRTLARLQAPQQGEVRLQGRDWQEYSPVQWRCRVHYLAQKPAVFNGTVLDNLQLPFQLSAVKKQKRFDLVAVQEAMKRILLPAGMLYQDARTLSGGEGSRLALLRALILEPSVLLLDEPTAALDERAAQAVWNLVGTWLKEKPNRGVVLVAHAGDAWDSSWDASRVSTLDIKPRQETGDSHEQRCDTHLRPAIVV